MVKIFRWRRLQGDGRQPFDAARADVSGHDAAQWKTVHRLQRHAVHFVSEDRICAQRLLESNRRAEADALAFFVDLVCAQERDVARFGRDTRGL